MRPVPVDNQRLDWPRLVANAINEMQKPREGETRYTAANGLQYWNGTEWVAVP